MTISSGPISLFKILLRTLALALVLARIFFPFFSAWGDMAALLISAGAVFILAYAEKKRGFKLFALDFVLAVTACLCPIRYFYDMGRSIFWLFAIAGVSALLIKWRTLPRDDKRSAASMILGLIFAVFYFAGYQILSFDRLEILYFNEWTRPVREMLAHGMNFLGLMILFTALLDLAYYLIIEKESSLCFRLRPQNRGLSRKSFVLLMTLVIFLLWLPYLIAFYPGFYSIDAFDEIALLERGEWYDHHPIIHQLLILFCIFAGDTLGSMFHGMGLYSIIQMIFMAFSFAYALGFLYEQGTRSWLLWLLAAFMSLNIANAMYSIYMLKDVIFAGFALLLFTVFVESVMKDSRGERSGAGELCWFVVVAVMFCLVRHNGMYAFLLGIAVVIVVNRRQWKKYALVLAAALMLVGGYRVLVYQVLDAEKGRTAEMLSVPLQQIARTVKYGGLNSLSQEDRQALTEVFPDLEELGEPYLPYLSDPVKTDEVFDSEKFDEDPIKYAMVWLRLGLKNPKVYVDAFLHQCYGYFYPDLDVGGEITDMPNYYYGIDWNESTSALRREIMNSFQYFKSSQFTGVVYCVGLQIWCVLFAWGALYIKGKGRWAVALAPTVFYWLTLLLSPVFCEFRYAYPVTVTVPYALVWALSVPREEIV